MTRGEGDLTDVTGSFFTAPDVFVQDVGTDAGGNLYFTLNDGRVIRYGLY